MLPVRLLQRWEVLEMDIHDMKPTFSSNRTVFGSGDEVPVSLLSAHEVPVVRLLSS